jgi:hypothetical protein
MPELEARYDGGRAPSVFEVVANVPDGEKCPLLLLELSGPLEAKRRPSAVLRAWALLLTGLMCWSSTGPLYVLLPPSLKLRPFRVALWRYLFGFAPFSIAFAAEVWTRGLRRDQRRQLTSLLAWPLFSALAFTTLGGFTFFGLAVANCDKFALAAGMAALNPFLLLLWERARGRSLGSWHLFGLILGTSGALVMVAADHLRSVTGTVQALTASAFFTGYSVAADLLSCQLPFVALMTITFGMGALLAAGLTCMIEGTTLSPGPESFWGFTADRYVFEVVASLTVAYTWGLTGLTASAKDLPPLVIAVGMALEPMCSCGIIALLENQYPGPGMTVAMVLLVFGSVIVGAAEAVLGKPPRPETSSDDLHEEIAVLRRNSFGSPFG